MSSPFLAHRTALVTGAAQGIGLAIAERLAAAGARVVLHDLPDSPRAVAAVRALRAAGAGDACFIGADLRTSDGIDALMDAALGWRDGIDILVNNAGIQATAPIVDMAPQRWDDIVAVNLSAAFHTMRRALPGMLARGFGRVVNIASVHGLVASPYKAAYVSAKHGLLGLTKTVALEAGARCPDVTIHAVCPSYVRTALVEGQVADQARRHGIAEEEVVEKVLLTQNAVRRLIEPDEVARMVEMLCGPGAWSMTGAALPMDAGWLAH
jgi:3-hydroxybutyrate dehydrogenase